MSNTAKDDDLWLNPTDEDASDAALKAAIQAELTELRGICMRFARRLDAKAETEQGQEDLAQLNNAAVKAARAVRQVGVLQLEIAGLRDRPGTRRSLGEGGAANQNAPKTEAKPYKNGPKPRDYAWADGDYTEYDDYADWELSACQSAKMTADLSRISDAMYADLTAHGRADACDQAPASLVELVRAIPHPALDACLNAMEPMYAFLVFGDENVRLTLAPASPDVWAEFDAQQKLYGRDRQDSS
jgi:hypothetical protein